MIVSFRHRGLERRTKAKGRNARPEHVRKTARPSCVLDRSRGPRDVDPARTARAPVKDIQGHYAVTVSGNWRCLPFQGWRCVDVDYLTTTEEEILAMHNPPPYGGIVRGSVRTARIVRDRRRVTLAFPGTLELVNDGGRLVEMSIRLTKAFGLARTCSACRWAYDLWQRGRIDESTSSGSRRHEPADCYRAVGNVARARGPLRATVRLAVAAS